MPTRRVNSTLPVFETDKELNNYLALNLTESIKQYIKVAIKTMIKEEMTNYKREVSELVGTLHFNGYYDRHLQSTFGEVRDVPIPRFRENTPGFTPASLQVFDGKKEELEKLIAQMHLLGVSQRKVERLVKGVYGISISKDRVGTIYQQLAEAEESQINHQPITDDYQYVLLDGIWGRAKGYGWEEGKAVILCVLGITPEGRRKIIGFKVSRGETYEAWHDLLLDLKERGLNPKAVDLFISDDADGLTSALEQLQNLGN